MIGVRLSTSIVLTLALLAAGGACDQGSVMVRNTLMQTQVPSRLLGRVASVNSLFIASSNELGSFESAVAARLFGLVQVAVLGGAVTLLTVGGIPWRIPTLQRLDDPRQTSGNSGRNEGGTPRKILTMGC